MRVGRVRSILWTITTAAVAIAVAAVAAVFVMPLEDTTSDVAAVAKRSTTNPTTSAN